MRLRAALDGQRCPDGRQELLRIGQFATAFLVHIVRWKPATTKASLVHALESGFRDLQMLECPSVM
jgi:hypothetical protein